MKDKHYKLLDILSEEELNIVEETDCYCVLKDDCSCVEYTMVELKYYIDIYFKILIEDYNIGKKEFCWSYILEDEEDCNRLILNNFENATKGNILAAVNDFIELLVWRKTRKKVK